MCSYFFITASLLSRQCFANFGVKLRGQIMCIHTDCENPVMCIYTECENQTLDIEKIFGRHLILYDNLKKKTQSLKNSNEITSYILAIRRVQLRHSSKFLVHCAVGFMSF